MFTGIVSHAGHVREVTPAAAGSVRLNVAVDEDFGTVSEGASVACSGICLTAVENGPGWFAADVSNETLAHTTVASWRAGTRVNLERPLKVGSELGGHFVLGHVDAVAEVISTAPDGESVRLTLTTPHGFAPLIAVKGSVVLDGVSLTVTESGPIVFGVNVILHTAAHTTLGEAVAGTRCNLEADPLARYVARIQEMAAT